MTNGILLLDKPQGLTSQAAVQRVRHAFGRVKGGHTGSLDPLATGMLPVCLGEATKVAGYLLEGDKEYLFTARFGGRTSTGDLEGPIVEEAEVPGDLEQRLRGILPAFTGPVQQIPPMYSALKRDGQPLYKLARQGIEVVREPRSVRILELEIRHAGPVEVQFHVRCSKGTYVRTLAEDLARAVGTCAHLSALRRTSVVPFDTGDMQTLEAVLAAPEQARLVSPDAALPHLPRTELGAESARRLQQGQTVVPQSAGEPGLARAYGPAGLFLGVVEIEPGPLVKPVRLFNNLGADST
jgi:tRNA pseudouridine55 synthase